MYQKFLLGLFLSLFCFSSNLFAQTDRWQQRVLYEMEIEFDLATHRFQGRQNLV